MGGDHWIIQRSQQSINRGELIEQLDMLLDELRSLLWTELVQVLMQFVGAMPQVFSSSASLAFRVGFARPYGWPCAEYA